LACSFVLADSARDLGEGSMSAYGTFRTWRDVRYESVMRSIADFGCRGTVTAQAAYFPRGNPQRPRLAAADEAAITVSDALGQRATESAGAFCVIGGSYQRVAARTNPASP
jgi:hypothetical protein